MKSRRRSSSLDSLLPEEFRLYAVCSRHPDRLAGAIKLRAWKPPFRTAAKGTVLPGHRLEITDPNSPEGGKVDVVVVRREKPSQQFGSALEFLESLLPGPRAFQTWEEYEQHLREEKDSWER